MKHVTIIVILWCIAIVATLLLVEKSVFSYLGPVYFICMVGSIITVRRAS
jgi:hypothetical protein